MNVPQLIVILLLLVALIRGEIFTLVVGSLIFPLLCYGLAYFGIPLNSDWLLFPIFFATLGTVFWCRSGNSLTLENQEKWNAALLTIGVFAVAFYCSAFRWPDFFPMGERLRDFALLASSRHDPFGAAEPWMAGVNTSYYLYWFRSYGLLGSMLGVSVAVLYHLAISLSITLYAISIWYLLRTIGVTKWYIRTAVALVTVFGSNLAGIGFWLSADTNWWGPSRVILGAINEFPSWSFVLGDLHPHVMNLSVVGFISTILLITLRSTNYAVYGAGIFFACVFGSVFLYGANAWEVPLVLAASVALIISGLSQKQFPKALRFDAKISVTWIGLILLTGVTFLANRHIDPQHYSWTLVKPPVPRTEMLELLNHFGLPLLLMALIICCRVSRDKWYWTGSIVLIAICGSAWMFLLAILLGVEMLAFGQKELSNRRALLALIAVGLLMVLIPEFIYLDDPYGGENERMNTIFKSYMPAWTLLHVGCITLALESFTPLLARLRWFEKLIAFVLVCSPFGFFFAVQPLRMTDGAKSATNAQNTGRLVEGLTNLELTYPGGEATVKKLRTLPDGIVLEGQGDAYSWTSHVSTLSEKSSYLGWTNHVRLLLKDGDAITHREKITEDVYKNLPACEEISSTLKSENIQYLVFGPREQEKYSGITADRFSCLRVAISEGRYVVYTTR